MLGQNAAHSRLQRSRSGICQSIEHQRDCAVPAATSIVLLPVLLSPAVISLRLVMMMPTPLGTVTINSTNAVETLISLVVPLCTVPTALPALAVSLPTVPTPLLISPLATPHLPIALLMPTNPTLSSLRFLAENVFSLRTIRRIQAWVCFRVRADVDAGAALMEAGLPVGDVADAHCDFLEFFFLIELSWVGLD